MTADAQRAIALIRECIAADRVWGEIKIICVIELDELQAEFITLYWDD